MRFKSDDKMKIFEVKKCYVMESKDDEFILDKVDVNENMRLMLGLHAFKHAPQMGEIMKDIIIHGIKSNDMFLLKRFQKSKL